MPRRRKKSRVKKQTVRTGRARTVAGRSRALRRSASEIADKRIGFVDGPAFAGRLGLGGVAVRAFFGGDVAGFDFTGSDVKERLAQFDFRLCFIVVRFHKLGSGKSKYLASRRERQPPK